MAPVTSFLKSCSIYFQVAIFPCINAFPPAVVLDVKCEAGAWKTLTSQNQGCMVPKTVADGFVGASEMKQSIDTHDTGADLFRSIAIVCGSALLLLGLMYFSRAFYRTVILSEREERARRSKQKRMSGSSTSTHPEWDEERGGRDYVPESSVNTSTRAIAASATSAWDDLTSIHARKPKSRERTSASSATERVIVGHSSAKGSSSPAKKRRQSEEALLRVQEMTELPPQEPYYIYNESRPTSAALKNTRATVREIVNAEKRSSLQESLKRQNSIGRGGSPRKRSQERGRSSGGMGGRMGGGDAGGGDAAGGRGTDAGDESRAGSKSALGNAYYNKKKAESFGGGSGRSPVRGGAGGAGSGRGSGALVSASTSKDGRHMVGNKRSYRAVVQPALPDLPGPSSDIRGGGGQQQLGSLSGGMRALSDRGGAGGERAREGSGANRQSGRSTSGSRGRVGGATPPNAIPAAVPSRGSYRTNTVDRGFGGDRRDRR